MRKRYILHKVLFFLYIVEQGKIKDTIKRNLLRLMTEKTGKGALV